MSRGVGRCTFAGGDNGRAAQVLLRVARSFNDKGALVQAANSFFLVGNFEDAEKLFAEAGETKGREYQLSRAENL